MTNDNDNPTRTPETLDEAAGMIAESAGDPVFVPRGSGSKWSRFDSPARGTILSTARLDTVVDYAPNDMTITVQAGMKLAALADVLAENNQRLALDPPHYANATVGGVLAANDSGPTRLANGTGRDLVIGMKIVLPDGRTVKSGGKVVKNVAGYDLHKLLIGSFGSLGLIGEVTFKLRPIPESRRLLVLKPADLPEVDRMIQQILRGPTRPAGIELLNARAARDLGVESPLGAFLLVVMYEDTVESASWQCDKTVETFGPSALPCSESESAELYESLREWPARPAGLAFKASMPAGNVGGFFHQCGWHPVSLLGHAASGIVFGQCEETDFHELLDEADHTLADQGDLVLLTPSSDARRSRWGRPRSDTVLMRRLKEKFDPNHRFVAGPFPDPAALLTSGATEITAR